VLLMVMVEYFAYTPTCALGDFACALHRADADVLAGDDSAFGDIASGVQWVQCDKVCKTFTRRFDPDPRLQHSKRLKSDFPWGRIPSL
jgi:hypothetical protein